jgi:hypothetical protein
MPGVRAQKIRSTTGVASANPENSVKPPGAADIHAAKAELYKHLEERSCTAVSPASAVMTAWKVFLQVGASLNRNIIQLWF